MADFAHDETERRLKALESKIAAMYDESAKELQKEIDRYFAQFEERDKKMKELIGTVQNGKEWTEQDYLIWRQNQIGRGKRFEALRDKLAERVTDANEVAISYVNDETPGVYSLNRNYTAYTIDTATGGGMSFDKYGNINADFILFDEQTVKRLIVEDPDLMPYYPEKKAIKRGIDLAYGKSQITKAVTSGIMQGKSIGKIANDLQEHISTMERANAVRAARTAMTGAQNAGRQDSYMQAEKMGIKVRKRWIATKDFWTRHSHDVLDGQTVSANEPFVSILGSRMMFPGDARGAVARDLYNCRCTMRTVEKEGIEAEPRMMRVRDPETGEWKLVEEMTYAEWAGWKTATQPTVSGFKKAQVQKAITAHESFAEQLANQKLSPHSTEYGTFEEFWEARKSFIANNGKESDFLDDVFAGKIDIGTGWGGDDGKRKIAQIENTIAELQKKYPLNPSKNLEYGTTIQKLRVCDYENAYMYLPDGRNDRRLVDSAIGQVFENDNRNAVIAFDRNWMYQTLEQTIEERSKAISFGKVLDSVNGSSPQTVVMHEWGHLMSNHITNAIINGESTAEEYWKWYKTLSKEEIRNGLSDYATTNRGEFEAECFAELMMPNPRPLALKFKEFLDKCIELGY